MVSEQPVPGDPMRQLDSEIFPVNFNPESGAVYVDPERLPKFDERVFGKKQVAAILEYITPAYWNTVQAETYLMVGDIEEEYRGPLILAKEINRTPFRLLDQIAPINEKEGDSFNEIIRWELWMYHVIDPQVSPLLTEDNPEIARSKMQKLNAVKKQRLRNFLEGLARRAEEVGKEIDNGDEGDEPKSDE